MALGSWLRVGFCFSGYSLDAGKYIVLVFHKFSV